MRCLGFLCASVGLSLSVFAQGRSVAITVDDLPYAGGSLAGASIAGTSSPAEIVNRKLLDAFQARHIPVTAFVSQKTGESLGPASVPRILKEWTRRGLDLENRTASHPDINGL